MAVKPAQIARIAAFVVVAFALTTLSAQQQVPSWTAITPGSIRAAGGPTGPLPPPRQAGMGIGVGVHPGGHHHPRGGFVGYGYSYGVPYYVEPAPPEPMAPPEPERPGLTIFEHNGKAIDQAVPAAPPQQATAEPAPAPPQQEERPGPSTILVFRDGHHQEVMNYAIIGDKLIILNEDRANRIPLAELDVDATIKANNEQGVEFRLPGRG